MAAKLTPRAEQILSEVAELAGDELSALLEAIGDLPPRTSALPARHAEIAKRIARVQRGEATTLSLDEAERSIRSDLDF